jgi:hypothetical protein
MMSHIVKQNIFWQDFTYNPPLTTSLCKRRLGGVEYSASWIYKKAKTDISRPLFFRGYLFFQGIGLFEFIIFVSSIL